MRQTIIAFELNQDERKTVEDVFYLEPWIDGSIDYRRRKGGKFQIKLDDDEAKDLMDALLFQAENEPVNAAKFISLAQKIHRFSKIIGKASNMQKGIGRIPSPSS